MIQKKSYRMEPGSLSHTVYTYLQDYMKNHHEILKTQSLYDIVMKEVEKPLIMLVLEQTNNNQSEAAAILGINRNTLRKKMTELKIKTK
jgi:two-component system nitrogen regulation response regulator GlnG